MSTSTSLETRARSAGETEIFRHSARTIHDVVRLNVDGLTQADSLIRPRPAGNCLNWVVGHLLCVYQNLLPMLKQRPVIKASALRRYDRGSPPIENADEAMELSELMAAWDGTAERIDAGLADLSAETLDAPAPFSPRGDPNETVRSLLTVIFFHQAYHAGQTGILRRIAGKDGAIS
jgi:hypothetical protein